MSILKYKYQAHKFVNYLFYIIVFAIGFFLGFAGKNIDFKKIIPNLLFIDNVSAFEIEINNNINFDEEFIIDNIPSSFYENSDFSLENYHYIVVTLFKGSDGYGYNGYYYNAYFFNNISSAIFEFDNQYGHLRVYGDYYYYRYYLNTNVLSSYKGYSSDGYFSYTHYYQNYIDHKTNFYTNFDIDFIDESDTYNVNSLPFLGANKLNFFGFNLRFDSDLFENDDNFKEVCVGPNANFVISSSEHNSCNLAIIGAAAVDAYASCNEDFMWFKYKITGSLKHFVYNSLNDSHGEYDDFSNQYFSSKEDIDSIYSINSEYSSLLNSLGYSDKYSYYGWNAVPFKFNYINDDVVYFDVYSFTYPKKESISQLGFIAGPLALYSLGFDEDIQTELNSDNYCFYINNKYEINYVDINELGDYQGSIITPNGSLQIETTYNSDHLDSQGLFSIATSFISKISDCISFINENIYNLYLSMPILLRMFIITFFTISLIKLIINMIVR